MVQGSRTGRGLGAAVARLSDHAQEWGPERLLDEGLDLVRDSTWADVVLLHSVEHDVVRVVARRPGRIGAGDTTSVDLPDVVPSSWFPWGLAPVQPKHYLLVDEATLLPTCPGASGTVASLGMRSCLHLPITERGRAVGALHLYWAEPRLAWDDDHGRLLRILGRFLLNAARGS